MTSNLTFDQAQSALPFVTTPNLSVGSFYISESNKNAYTVANDPNQWPYNHYMIVAPHGYGKTHLGRIFQDKFKATWIEAAHINETTIDKIQPYKYFVVDNVDQTSNETVLFHMYNLFKEHKCCVLYLSQREPAGLGFTLKDLISRLHLIPYVAIGSPDDELLLAVLHKLFSDYQLKVPMAILMYLTRHMDRSLTSAKHIVDLLNKASLDQKRNITIPFIKSILRF